MADQRVSGCGLNAEQPAVGWRELTAIGLLIVLCDATIYRGHGFAGAALLFAVAPICLALGAPRPRFGAGFWITGAMLMALSAKMLWSGSVVLTIFGVWLLAAFAAALAGVCPYVLETLLLASRTISSGYGGLLHYDLSFRRRLFGSSELSQRPSKWKSVVMPVATCVVFSFLFICANPDLAKFMGTNLQDFFSFVRDWLFDFSPNVVEVLIWIGVLWASVGLLRPQLGLENAEESGSETDVNIQADETTEAAEYAAIRNTLGMVIVLFAVYLGFEFKTLWFRVFPKGFYYSGYAHEGAAWLTAALVLATVILSVFFRGRVLRDSRLAKLRRLAWVWSLENFILAMAVYHRLLIYVGFNGMTRMRMVGFFGMSAVVAGFVLVVWKIARNRDFVWLMRNQLWVLAFAAYLFAITPVDAMVMRYNVGRILADDPTPSVQISVHPFGPDGVMNLLPALDCKDATIKEGIAAMLAKRHLEATELIADHRSKGWSAFQWADSIMLELLDANKSRWAEYAKDAGKRDAAIKEFHKYAYQWY